MFMAMRRASAGALENISAKQWIEQECGPRVYDAMWRPLFDLKFYEFADNISAAWLWTRIKRVGTSRKSLFQEELGYIDGGSETLVRALVDAIEKRGGAVRLVARLRKSLSRTAPSRACGLAGRSRRMMRSFRRFRRRSCRR